MNKLKNYILTKLSKHTYRKENGVLCIRKGIIFKKWIPLVPHIKEKHPKEYELIKDEIE